MDIGTFSFFEALVARRDPLTLGDIAGHAAAEPWRADAACREHPDLPWVPERGVSMRVIAKMKAICASCLVRDECAAFALECADFKAQGIWGGMSGRDRRTYTRVTAPKRNQPAADGAIECREGHAMVGENLYVTPAGRRVCKTCRREYMAERRQAQRAA